MTLDEAIEQFAEQTIRLKVSDLGVNKHINELYMCVNNETFKTISQTTTGGINKLVIQATELPIMRATYEIIYLP